MDRNAIHGARRGLKTIAGLCALGLCLTTGGTEPVARRPVQPQQRVQIAATSSGAQAPAERTERLTEDSPGTPVAASQDLQSGPPTHISHWRSAHLLFRVVFNAHTPPRPLRI